MNNFKDFAIKPKANTFVGEKIKAKNVINAPIIVFEFKIEPSKAIPGTEFMTLQIEKAGDKRIVFISSKIMIDQIKRVPPENFPFHTTIKGDNGYYEFT